MEDKIITKIESNKDLTEKEIDFLNNISVCSVYGFTNSIGHLTLFGKNDAVKQYKQEILEELYRKKYWKRV